MTATRLASRLVAAALAWLFAGAVAAVCLYYTLPS